MSRALSFEKSSRLSALVLVTLLGAAVAPAQDAAAGSPPAAPAAQAQGPRTDGQIEMDVVHALDASAALKNDLITAATIQTEVTLSGTVSSEASKKLAESIASHVDGVAKVHNNLKVGDPTQDAQYTPPPDPAAQDMPGQDMPGNDQAANTPGLPPPGMSPEQANAQPQQPAYGQPQPPAYGQPQQPEPSLNQSYPPPPPQAGYPPARPQYQNPQYSQYPPPQPYPQQQQYPPQYAPPPQPYQAARGPVTIPQGTLLYLRTSEPVESKHAREGEQVQLTVIQDVNADGALAIPRGATVHAVVSESKQVGSGELAGHSYLALRLVSLDLGGMSYPLQSDEFRIKSPNKAGQTVGNAVGAGIIGTIIGCAVGRGVGCAVGAGAGVAAGTAASAASSGPRAWIPAEALVSFHLATPLTVQPVPAQEAARLAEGLYPGGPTLYRRGPYGGPRYYAGYGGYPGYYPPVYYRPYYVTGGFYYWR